MRMMQEGLPQKSIDDFRITLLLYNRHVVCSWDVTLESLVNALSYVVQYTYVIKHTIVLRRLHSILTGPSGLFHHIFIDCFIG